MTLDDAITRYTSNAFYEKSDGNLQGYLEFEQLAKWLKELKAYREMYHKEHENDCLRAEIEPQESEDKISMSVIEDIKAEIQKAKEFSIDCDGKSDLGIALDIIDKHMGEKNEID